MPSKETKYLFLNGVLVDASLPVWKQDDRMSRYGDGLFESIRMISGEIMLLNEHLLRLTTGLKALKIAIPNAIRSGKIMDEINTLAQKNSCFGNARIRVQVSRGNGGFYAPENSQSSYLISAEPIDDHDYKLNKKGLSIGVYRDILKPINILSDYKTCNALIYVMAGIWKTGQKHDDCIILNENQNVCESLSSNVFFVKDNVIYTPADDEGCIHGVMRKHIMNLAAGVGFKVIDSVLSDKDMEEMDEIFLTNASSGIRWVGAYKQKRYYNKVAALLVKELNSKK